jgi:peptidoglycan-associated lipoprotein
MKKMYAGLGMVAAVLLLLQGCTSPGDTRPGDVPVEDRSVGVTDGADMGRDGRGAQTGTAAMAGSFAGRPIQEVLSDPETPLSKRVFYFDFNSSELPTEDREALAFHARFMNEYTNVTVVLEGHADERGSREYNLALGERRAQAIERILSLAGVAAEQIQVISFGEERPVALGHEEEDWRLNRRVELLYSGY